MIIRIFFKKCRVPLEILRAKWNSIHFRTKTLICAVSAFVMLMICVFLHHQYVHRYDSATKLAAVYDRNQSAFQTAREVLCELPSHAHVITEGEDPLTYYYSQTAILREKGWDPSHYWACCRKIDALWICSCIPFTDEEYDTIYSAVTPIFDRLSIDAIFVSPARDFVDFTLHINSGTWSGFQDCIFYDSTITALDIAEYRDTYYLKKHYQTHCNGVPDEIAEVDEHWFVQTTNDFH